LTRREFTLIELLIVVAIIVILAAMLLPALARTKYVARLTVCSGELNQWGTGLTMWAGDHNNRLPERSVYTVGNRQAHMLKNGSADDRELFDEILGLEFTDCPFVREVPYDKATDSGYYVFSSYEFWAGAQIDHGQKAS